MCSLCGVSVCAIQSNRWILKWMCIEFCWRFLRMLNLFYRFFSSILCNIFLCLHICISLNYFYIFHIFIILWWNLLGATFLSGFLDTFRRAEVNILLHMFTASLSSVSHSNLSSLYRQKLPLQTKQHLEPKHRRACVSLPLSVTWNQILNICHAYKIN